MTAGYSRVLTCPFCGSAPEDPHKISMSFGETVGGRCGCGAVYVYDETGRLLGEAFVDALALLFGEDYEAAFSAGEEEYEEQTISYDRFRGRFTSGARAFDKNVKFVFLKKKEQK